MKFQTLFFACIFSSMLAFYSSNLWAAGDVKHIKLSIEIEPSAKVLKGVFECNNPADSVFLLAKGLKVESVITDGENVDFLQLTSDSSATSVSCKLHKKYSNLKISYSGKINEENFPRTISNQNRITRQMLELTDVIDWYPRFKNSDNCTFSLSVKAPKEFGFVTNGEQTEISETGVTNETRFESQTPVSRIFLIG